MDHSVYTEHVSPWLLQTKRPSLQQVDID